MWSRCGREFTQTVAAARKGAVPDEWLTHTQRAVNTRETSQLAIWEPWRQTTARTGEDELKTTVKSGT
eukprot:4555372-Lingulodinium_polyedra.AAC.1